MRADVLIIGAGASGLAAAVAAGRTASGKRILLIEKNDGPGKKIYATGNGRCNILNSRCSRAGEIIEFFRGIGLEMREEEEGRMYPMSQQSSDVVFVLEKAAARAGAEIICGAAAEKIEKTDEGFTVTASKAKGGKLTVHAGKVIIASGGKAGPMYGSTGDGYRLAKSLGHTYGKLVPALTGIETVEDTKELKGTRAGARVTLLRKGQALCEETGTVQFTDYGLSGICIFNLSRYVVLGEETAFEDYQLSLDLFPDTEEEELARLLRWRAENVKGIEEAGLLTSLTPRTLADYIEGAAGRGEKATDAEQFAGLLKDLRFTAGGMRGWKMAQVTKGGISSAEIDEETMESKVAPGLYFAGEITDYDGPCGGYNLYNAWLTGITAGEAAAKA